MVGWDVAGLRQFFGLSSLGSIFLLCLFSVAGSQGAGPAEQLSGSLLFGDCGNPNPFQHVWIYWR